MSDDISLSDRFAGDRRLGRFLRLKRLEKEYTQSYVAKKIGLKSGQYLSNVERGCCCISLKFLKKLIALYDLQVEDVLSLMLAVEKEYWLKVLGKRNKR